MKISDERKSHLAEIIAKNLVSNGIIEADSETLPTKEIRRGFVFFEQELNKIDERVREKIDSIKRGVAEGSAEWEILYRQYYNEELERL